MSRLRRTATQRLCDLTTSGLSTQTLAIVYRPARSPLRFYLRGKTANRKVVEIKSTAISVQTSGLRTQPLAIVYRPARSPLRLCLCGIQENLKVLKQANRKVVENKSTAISVHNEAICMGCTQQPQGLHTENCKVFSMEVKRVCALFLYWKSTTLVMVLTGSIFLLEHTYLINVLKTIHTCSLFSHMQYLGLAPFLDNTMPSPPGVVLLEEESKIGPKTSCRVTCHRQLCLS